MLARLRSSVAALLGRSRIDEEMNAEFRAHIDAYASDLIDQGLAPAAAARRARVRFGSVVAVKEECLEARGLLLLHDFQSDLQYAARRLKRTPTFTVVAVLTLALGIGINTAVFSVFNTLLFQPLPYPDEEQLVYVFRTGQASQNGPHNSADFLTYRRIRTRHGRRCAGQQLVPGEASGNLRVVRTCARRRWRVRSNVLLRRATNERNRNPPGAGSTEA